MRTFQAICVALAIAAGHCGNTLSGSRSLSYAYGGPALATVRTTSYTHAAPAFAAPVAVAAAPRYAVSAAPVHVAAAPVAVAAAPTNVGVIAHAPAPAPRTHEIHTGSGRQAIRIEDSQAGDQVIRVREGPQAPPQIAQVVVPGQQEHIRVVNHQPGPAHVERVVQRQPTQVIDVQKPGRPGARIVQVVRGQSPAPQIEFVNAGGSEHHVYHANDAAPAVAVAHAAPAVTVAHAASEVAVPAAPAYAAVPAFTATHAAPVYAAAPAVAVHHAAPAFTAGISYGARYGSTAVLH